MRVVPGGERVPFLLDDRGVPLFYPTLFATTQLRNNGAAVNTIRNKLSDIVVLLRWEAINHRDLLQEFRGGKFLGTEDIVSLRDFMRQDMRDVRDRRNHKSRVSNALLEAHVGSVKSANTVGKQQHYNRMTTTAEYLGFLGSLVIAHRRSPDGPALIANMVDAIKRHRPRNVARSIGDDSLVKSPPTELIDRFMAVAAVDHPDNPFHDPGVRLRNAIVFGLLYHTGMRRGELLSLRIGQFELGEGAYVEVRRNQDDKYDDRPNQPVAKTKERMLPIPRVLADQVQEYSTRVRAKIRPARTHPYLFVSHKQGQTYGHPLSLSALGGRIMEEMRSVDPEFSNIHLHSFRHHFNYRLSKRIDELNAVAGKEGGGKRITSAEELNVRAFLNGHRSTASGEIYNQRHVRERADEVVRQLQSQMVRKKD